MIFSPKRAQVLTRDLEQTWLRPLCSSPCPPVPVGSNFDVQGHFDVEQVLVLPELSCHLPLGVPQLAVKLLDGFLWAHRAIMVGGGHTAQSPGAGGHP